MRRGRPEAREGWAVRRARLLLFGAMPWFARGAPRTGGVLDGFWYKVWVCFFGGEGQT